MKEWQSQAHVKWECKYHVVILPKYRKKAMYGRLRGKIGKILRELCRQKDVELVEGKAMPDHVHMLLSNLGNPPAVPGDSQSLTYTGVVHQTLRL